MSIESIYLFLLLTSYTETKKQKNNIIKTTTTTTTTTTTSAFEGGTRQGKSYLRREVMTGSRSNST